MGLLGDLFDRFKKQPSLWDLKLDDLNRERITLQQEQHKLDMEADRLHTRRAGRVGFPGTSAPAAVDGLRHAGEGHARCCVAHAGRLCLSR